LSRFPTKDVEIAVDWFIENSKWMPRLSEIIGKIEGRNKHIEEDLALRAWNELLEAIKKPSLAQVFYSDFSKRDSLLDTFSSKFKDRLIPEIVRSMGGWWSVRNWTLDEIKWRKRDFFDIYQSFRRKATLDQKSIPGDYGKKIISLTSGIGDLPDQK